MEEEAPTRVLPEQTEVPLEGTHVFFSLDSTADAVKELNHEQRQITFIRGGVAMGKSTLATYLTQKHEDEFVEVMAGTHEFEWCSNMHRAFQGTGLNVDLETGKAAVAAQQAVEELVRANKTLVIDEGHLLFECRDVCGKLMKSWLFGHQKNKIKMILFSSTGRGLSKAPAIPGVHQKGGVTPSEISKKCVWYPKMPEGGDLVEQLSEAGVHLDGPAIDLMAQVCSSHYGIFMEAMRWVKEKQERQAETTPWNYARCLTEVRQSFQESDAAETNGNERWPSGLRAHMKRSRAVHVNGDYDFLSDVPQEVIAIIFGGSQLADELNSRERDLSIAGFLLPERLDFQNEFDDYNWGSSTRYGIANALMGQCYGGWLQQVYRKTFRDTQPRSGPDLLARVFPYLSFSMVVANVPNNLGKKTPLSSAQFPYEDNYNGAMCKVLQEMGYAPVQPGNDNGKPDVVANFKDQNDEPMTCAIESIMATRSNVSYGPVSQTQMIR